MAVPIFEVVDGGFLTTVQDAGRLDWTHLGVPESGAADPWSLAVANRLLDNDPGSATLELTVTGPTLRVLRDATVAVAGADLGGVTDDGRRVRPGRSHRLRAGQVLAFPGPPGPDVGVRAVLAVPGGVDVPIVLGSRSTCLAAAFGGLGGRPLAEGDTIAAAAAGVPAPAGSAWPGTDPRPEDGRPALLRVLPGPSDGLDALERETWRVSGAADRVGIRLDGPPLPDGIAGETTTHGVVWGAIQVPPDGRPIILGPDHQTTGGYRVVGVVISADRAVLGQLGPGTSVRIERTDAANAAAAFRAQRDALVAGSHAIRDAAGWDALAETAGG